MSDIALEGVPDLGHPTPPEDVFVHIPLDAWKVATSWITGAKPSGKDDPLDQILIRFGNHPLHYTKAWNPEHIFAPAVTLATTDRWRLAYATIEDLADPDSDNRLKFIAGQDTPGAVSVDASDCLKAMRGWPTITPEEIAAHAVEIAWDPIAQEVRLTFFNIESGQHLTTNILPLFDGLHEFPSLDVFAPGLPTPYGLFAVNPDYLKALAAAGSNVRTGRLQIRAHDKHLIMLRSEPCATQATHIHMTAAMTPSRDPNPDQETP